MASFFHTTIFEPIYNGLVFLIAITPFADSGVAVINLPIAIQIFLFCKRQKKLICFFWGFWIFPKKVFCWRFCPAFPNSFKQNWQCRRLNRVATSPTSRPIWRGVWAYKCVMFFPLWWSLSLTAFLALLLYIGQQVISLPSLRSEE